MDLLPKQSDLRFTATCTLTTRQMSQFFQVQDVLLGPFIFTKVNLKKRPTTQSRCLIQLGLMPLNLAELLT